MKWENNKYIKEFLSLNCSKDILEVLKPILNIEKEITESMAVIRKLRGFALPKPNYYSIEEYCAGNALTSAIAIHLLPFRASLAFDIKKRDREWPKIKHFMYMFCDIYDDRFTSTCFQDPTIMFSIHPCTKLAERIIDIYNNSNAEALILMPCCIGELKMGLPQIIKERIGKYLIWTWQLANRIKESKISIQIDNNCISPKNAIITARRVNNP